MGLRSPSLELSVSVIAGGVATASTASFAAGLSGPDDDDSDSVIERGLSTPDLCDSVIAQADDSNPAAMTAIPTNGFFMLGPLFASVTEL